MSTEKFRTVANQLLSNVACLRPAGNDRRFRAVFGVPLGLCPVLWAEISRLLPMRGQHRHLFWGLMFLKGYMSEEYNGRICAVDEKTFRRWSWAVVKALAEISTIIWNGRFEGRAGSPYNVSVDGVDMRICEPSPFSRMWYSHKFKGARLRYEVGVAIGTGHIVWIHGRFPCGTYPDLKIYREGMKLRLLGGEKLVADDGYPDNTCSSFDSSTDKSVWRFVRARHEVTNKRLKQFAVLSNRFRHPLKRHVDCFYAVANITQLLIEAGEAVFTVYNES